MSPITALTADYDAIERAIRETSRGRWFLSCYLQRNRSAETKMLLDAIAKLESAMRDSGHTVEALTPLDAVAALKEAIGQARYDIAEMAPYDSMAAHMPLQRFSFESIPTAIADETRAIRDAAANIQSAAYAMQAAGVFQGVARQMAERAEEIERACSAQDAALNRAARMAALVSEIEAELMALFEDEVEEEQPASDGAMGEIRQFFKPREKKNRAIPEGVMEELSAVLGEHDQDDELANPFDR
jgi:hypothetical protein